MNINDLHLKELYRFAEIGRMSASLLHEISNPLSAAILNLEMSDHTSPAVRKARRNMHLLRQYVDAARQQVRSGNRPTNFSLLPQMNQLEHVLHPIAKQAVVRLEFELPQSDYLMRGDPIKFQQIVANLVINAIQAYANEKRQRGQAVVRVTIKSHKGWLVIRVTDWGEGIPRAEIPKLFDMFYTTKAINGQGMGLGLAIVKQYVTADFNGSINVSSSSRQGTTFIAKLRHSPIGCKNSYKNK